MSVTKDNLASEAKAFDKRITERLNEGFVPDIRQAVKTDYFYKSFWRDPQFIQLYLGRQIEVFIDMLTTHCGSGLKILDVGCGAGYMSLELARNGYHITAIDISSESIKIANEVLKHNPYIDTFGSLQYKLMSFEEIDTLEEQYDVILFSVSLHHMLNVEDVVNRCYQMLPENGFLLAHEPCHERFQNKDAAQVALIRGILSLTGHWYEKDIYDSFLNNATNLNKYIEETRIEYFLERDKNEPEGQSPNDLEANGVEMLSALREHFKEIDYRKSTSFIYRVLGGIRGDDEFIKKMANFLALYDQQGVENGYIHENFFYFLGKK